MSSNATIQELGALLDEERNAVVAGWLQPATLPTRGCHQSFRTAPRQHASTTADGNA